MRKVTNAEEVREAIRDAAEAKEGGLYSRIEAEITRMKETGQTTGFVWLTRGTPQWLIDEATKTYRDADFEVAIEDIPSDGRGSDDGGLRMSLRVK